MRKKVLMILCIIALLLLPALVHADVGGPMIQDIDCVVSNPDGASYYVWDGDEYVPAADVIPYGTILSIMGETYTPDFMMTESSSGRIGTTFYNDDYIFIDMRDFAVVDQTDPLEEAYPFPDKVVKKVIAKDGVAVYGGPSPVFDQVGVIPYGATIAFTYGDAYADFASCSLAYGEWKDIKGWVLTYNMWDDATLASRVDKTSQYAGVADIADEGVCLVDISQYDYDSGECAVISAPLPVGTVLSFDYYYTGYGGTYALVNYNGQEGFLPIAKMQWQYEEEYTDVYTGVLVYHVDQYMVLRSDSVLYAKAGDRDSALDITVPANSILAVEADYMENNDRYTDNLCNCWSLVSFQGKQGYILRENLNLYNLETFSDTLHKAESYAFFTVYEEPDTNSAVVKRTRSVDDLYVLYTTYTNNEMFYFVAGPDYAGWVCDGIYEGDPAGPGAVALLSELLGVEPEGAETLPEAMPVPQEIVEENVADATDGQEEEKETEEQDEEESVLPGAIRSTQDTIILIACAAVIGAVTATAIIFLFRKKKK